MNSLSGPLDFDLVVSSQLMTLGNFIIRRAAMFTFCPITVRTCDDVICMRVTFIMLSYRGHSSLVLTIATLAILCRGKRI